MIDAFANEEDFALLQKDPYTFSVLNRILREECRWIQTDHQSVIACHSALPYPVWIWTMDGCADAVKEMAWQLAAARCPLAEGYRINMKHDLAAYFIEKARQVGLKAGVSMELFAYDCPHPVAPDCPAEGFLYPCTLKDVQEAAALMPAFQAEIGNVPRTPDDCESAARDAIQRKAFFFWKNAAGKTVACCSYRAHPPLGSLGHVYTLPAHRRLHYAQRLVYQVTKIVQAQGLTPMLYTDAGYQPSNACYEKIGYRLRGRLCTVSLLA